MSRENAQSLSAEATPPLRTTGASHARHEGDVSGVSNYGNQYLSDSAQIRNTTYNISASPHNPRAMTYKQAKRLIETETTWAVLQDLLSIVDQDQNKSEIPYHDWNEPKFYWITKNIDFKRWEVEPDVQTLWITAPHSHWTTQICSHIVDRVKQKASDAQTNGTVLYFFGRTATEARRATALTHTILHPVCCSSASKADSIALAFLNALLDGQFHQHAQAENAKPQALILMEDDSLETTILKILDAPDKELVEALLHAIKEAVIQELWIIADGLHGDIAYWLAKYSMEVAPVMKALVTSQQSPKSEEIFGRMLSIEYDRERLECLHALQYEDTRYENISEQHHGSLEWLWVHPQYVKWSQSATSSLLYVEGKPGSGKSTLVKYFEKNLTAREPKSISSTVARYFYSFRGTIKESTHQNMLRSILHSLLEQDESTFFHFQQHFRNLKKRSDWPYDSLKTILSSFADYPSTKPVYLILDAMDESSEDDRRSIVQLICNLCSEKNPCYIKVFLASRPLRHCIRGSHHTIIMQEQNKNDIARFADDFLSDLQLSGEVLREATDYITDNAQGVFVWVALVKAELVTCVETGAAPQEIMRRLKGLPQELEDFYTFMRAKLERGQPRDILDGIALFQFVLFALRPPTVEEVCDILALPSDGHKLSQEEFQLNRRDPTRTDEITRRIAHCGGNFLEIKADGVVQFMHQTAREFFFQTNADASTLKFEVDPRLAHRLIATQCLQYLILCFTNNAMVAPNVNSLSLTNCQLGCGRNKGLLRLVTALIQQLLANQHSYLLGRWMANRLGQTNSALHFLKDVLLSRARGMHLKQAIVVHMHRKTAVQIHCKSVESAAELRLSHVLEVLLLTYTDENGHTYDIPPSILFICVRNGLKNAIQLLLERNVHIDATDDLGQTALHHAAKDADETIIRLLLRKGASKEIKDNDGNYPVNLTLEKFP
ncbi:hypothetical protein K440DRAFT_662625 [Wilcoxina mikolae CBS 423.85]|nr:hypothetical protein K440DRAFT_662625 [Wilcoxina mikolae CBS 423.85]